MILSFYNLKKPSETIPIFLKGRRPLPKMVSDYQKTVHQVPEDISIEKLDFEFPFLCATGDLKTIEDAIRRGANVKAPRTEGITPISVSAKYGHVDVSQCLQRNGADVNTPDQLGWTPIMISAQSGHLEVVKFLQQ